VLYCCSGLCVCICALMKYLKDAEGGRMAIGVVCVVLWWRGRFFKCAIVVV
jgi:hypothetical protein